MILDIFVALFIIITLWKIKPLISKKETNSRYLTQDTCNSYKGFFAIIVLLHHLAQRISPGIIISDFTGVGYLAVSMFFFFSGFGLQKKNLSDNTYKNGFLLKRIPAILIPYAVMTFIYWLLYALLGDVRTISDMWTEFYKWGNPIVWFSWYVVSILVFYIAFYVLMKIFKQRKFAMVLGGIIYYIIYLIICRALSFGPWWYMTSFILVLGILWASWEEEILTFLKKSSFILMPFIWVIFVLVSVNQWNIRNALSQSWSEVIFCMIMSTLFVLGVILTSARFMFGNKILNFLGNISFELYMVQGAIMLALRNDYFYIGNDTVWSLAVILCSIIFAFLLNKLFNFMLLKYKKLILR